MALADPGYRMSSESLAANGESIVCTTFALERPR